jgi:hypothetical protein
MIKLYKIQAVHIITKEVKFVIEYGHSINLTSIENDGTMFTDLQAETYIKSFNEHEGYSDHEFSKWYTHLVYDPKSGEMTDDLG